MKNIKIIISSLLAITILSTNSFVTKANEEILEIPTADVLIEEVTNDITQIIQQNMELVNQIIEEEENNKAYSEEDLKLMSCIIWHEAGNQCEAGQQAVGIVVMNRLDSEDFKNTVEEVLYEPGQFVTKSDSVMNKAIKMYERNDLPQECIKAAQYALENNKTVNYNGQEIDMSPYLYFATSLKNKKIEIQDHDFK